MKYFNLHTHKPSGDPEIVELVNRYPDDGPPSGLYSVGIHPWYIDPKKISSQMERINGMTSDGNCIAIGECGLDKRVETPIETQKEVFYQQLEIAQAHQKPVVLHCVAAYQEVIKARNDLKIGVPMIIHGFSKNLQVARQLLDNGFYLSFGKYLLRNPELEEVFANVPEERIFLETDTIEEPLQEVYRRAASYKKVEAATIQEIVWQNFKTVFKGIGPIQ